MRVLWNEIVRNYFMDQSDIEPFEVNEEFDANGYPVNAEREEIIT